MAECEISTSTLATRSGVSVDEIEAVIGGEDISLSKAEHLLRLLGAESAVLVDGEPWQGNVKPLKSINENLYKLFVWRPVQIGHSPIWFFLQYLDRNNVDLTKDLLTKVAEFHEPRITVLDVALSEEADRWDINIYYFEHEGKSLGNFVFPFCPLKKLEDFPEVTRRRAYEDFIRHRNLSSAIETIDSAKWTLENQDNGELEIDLALIQMQALDLKILDAATIKRYHDTLNKLKLRKSQQAIGVALSDQSKQRTE